MKEYPDFQDNVKNVVRTLKSMGDILSKFEIDPRTEINPDTKRKKVIDAKITVYGSEYFQNEQIKINAHHRRLDKAVATQSGEYLIEPRVNEELNATEYLKKRDKYNKLKAGQ